jgi:hypothetical protein
MASTQNEDGSWVHPRFGGVYGTSLRLGILQLDNGTLPIHQR